MTAFRSILDSAQLVGRERYIEISCFRALGDRALRGSESSVLVALAAVARGHAWRARELEELLPVSLGLPGVDQSTRAPGEDMESAISLLTAELDDSEVARALARVLYPAMLASYRAHLVSGSDAADRHLSTVLRRVISDLEARLDDLSDVVEIDDGPLAGTSSRLAELVESSSGPFGALG